MVWDEWLNGQWPATPVAGTYNHCKWVTSRVTSHVAIRPRPSKKGDAEFWTKVIAISIGVFFGCFGEPRCAFARKPSE